MQEINIKLWRHEREKDWSVEVKGKLHKHVPTQTVDELVEYALVAAQEALMEQDGLFVSFNPVTSFLLGC